MNAMEYYHSRGVGQDSVYRPQWRRSREYGYGRSMYPPVEDYRNRVLRDNGLDYDYTCGYRGPFGTQRKSTGPGRNPERKMIIHIPWDVDHEGRAVLRDRCPHVPDVDNARPHSRYPEFGVLDPGRPDQQNAYTSWGHDAYSEGRWSREHGYDIDQERIPWTPDREVTATPWEQERHTPEDWYPNNFAIDDDPQIPSYIDLADPDANRNNLEYLLGPETPAGEDIYDSREIDASRDDEIDPRTFGGNVHWQPGRAESGGGCEDTFGSRSNDVRDDESWESSHFGLEDIPGLPSASEWRDYFG